jgi:hypothetical protein
MSDEEKRTLKLRFRDIVFKNTSMSKDKEIKENITEDSKHLQLTMNKMGMDISFIPIFDGKSNELNYFISSVESYCTFYSFETENLKIHTAMSRLSSKVMTKIRGHSEELTTWSALKKFLKNTYKSNSHEIQLQIFEKTMNFDETLGEYYERIKSLYDDGVYGATQDQKEFLTKVAIKNIQRYFPNSAQHLLQSVDEFEQIEEYIKDFNLKNVKSRKLGFNRSLYDNVKSEINARERNLSNGNYHSRNQNNRFRNNYSSYNCNYDDTSFNNNSYQNNEYTNLREQNSRNYQNDSNFNETAYNHSNTNNQSYPDNNHSYTNNSSNNPIMTLSKNFERLVFKPKT